MIGKYIITYLPTNTVIDCIGCEKEKGKYFTFMYGVKNLWFCEDCSIAGKAYIRQLNVSWAEFQREKKRRGNAKC